MADSSHNRMAVRNDPAEHQVAKQHARSSGGTDLLSDADAPCCAPHAPSHLADRVSWTTASGFPPAFAPTARCVTIGGRVDNNDALGPT